MINWMLGVTFGLVLADLLHNPEPSWLTWGLLTWAVVGPVWNWTVRR